MNHFSAGSVQTLVWHDYTPAHGVYTESALGVKYGQASGMHSLL